MINLQELQSDKIEPKGDRIRATRLATDRLSAQSGAAGCSRSQRHRYIQRWEIQRMKAVSITSLSNL